MILIIGVVTSLAVSDFTFLDKVKRRPPKAVFLETIKLAKLTALDEGEEVSLYFDEKTFDMVARRSYDGKELFRKNLYSMDEDSKIKEQSNPETDSEKTDLNNLNQDENQVDELEKQRKREQKFSNLPKIEVIFKPRYPEVYNFTTNDLKGIETLKSLRFSPDSSMTPANIELKIDSKSVLNFDIDVFSGYPLDKSKSKSKNEI